jgi:hypothetical protein
MASQTQQPEQTLCDRCRDLDVYGLLEPLNEDGDASAVGNQLVPQFECFVVPIGWHDCFADVRKASANCTLCALVLKGWSEYKLAMAADEESSRPSGRSFWHRKQIAGDVHVQADALGTFHEDNVKVSCLMNSEAKMSLTMDSSQGWMRLMRFSFHSGASVPGERLEADFRIMIHDSRLSSNSHGLLRTRDGYRVDRLPDQDPLSPQSLSVAQNWIKNCCRSHGDICNYGAFRVGEDGKLVPARAVPTRLLELSADGNTVHLIEIDAQRAGQGPEQSYVALSHCWGSHGTPFTTTRLNYHERQQRIEVAAMPQTFQDAVTTCRRLGLSYLWIDSLCIVQDDATDWALESSFMADTYRYAFLVLSATRSNADAAGFLGPRTLQDTVRVYEGRESGLTVDLAQVHRGVQGVAWQKGYDPMADEPLTSRAWCLQERSLARRSLHYASGGMFWECERLRASEMGEVSAFQCETKLSQWAALDTALDTPSRGRSVFSRLDRNPDTETLYVNDRGWYKMVEEYTKRGITTRTDRLPALSGLSRMKGQYTEERDIYLAGLWRSSLLEGLMWCSADPKTGVQSPTPDYIAPSWSWASVVGSVCFPMYDWYASRAKGTEQLKLADFEALASYAAHNLEQAGPDPNGQLRSGHITLRILLPLHTVAEITQKSTTPSDTMFTSTATRPRSSPYTSRLFKLLDSSGTPERQGEMWLEGDLDLEDSGKSGPRTFHVIFLSRLPFVMGSVFLEHRFGLVVQEMIGSGGLAGYRRTGFIDGFVLNRDLKPVQFDCVACPNDMDKERSPNKLAPISVTLIDREIVLF